MKKEINNEDIENEFRMINKGILTGLSDIYKLKKQVFIQFMIVYIMLGFIIGGLIAIAMHL